MTSTPAGTRSLWMEETLRLQRSPLTQDVQADICIIGAGIAGLLCAYTLARRDRRVIVLDAGPIAGGETGRTTAHLSNAIDNRYFLIEHMHGPVGSAISAVSHTAAINLIERIVNDERIDCDFARVDGYLFLPPRGSPDLLTREHAAAYRAGLTGVQLVPTAPSFNSGPALRFPNQAQFHPLRFLDGLASAVERLGVTIHTDTRVTQIERESHADEPHPTDHARRLRVRTARGPAIHADSVIVATNSPINDVVTMHTKQAAYRTYAFSASIPPGSITRALYWDASESAGEPTGAYHYVRLASRGRATSTDDLIIVGGGDHLTGDHNDLPPPWNKLESWARERWPAIGDIIHRWSGQVLEPLDSAAFIGPNPTGPDGVYIITGDSGMGMTHAAIAAIMLPDLIQGLSHPWLDLYDPSRKPLASLREFAKHAARMTTQYADWLAPGAGIKDIAPGQGRVVRRGLKLLAAYRDVHGDTHIRSAACTHLGCIVHWNQAEGSWDCPCHGSRFDAFGRVISGPARRDLAAEPNDPEASHA